MLGTAGLHDYVFWVNTKNSYGQVNTTREMRLIFFMKTFVTKVRQFMTKKHLFVSINNRKKLLFVTLAAWGPGTQWTRYVEISTDGSVFRSTRWRTLARRTGRRIRSWSSERGLSREYCNIRSLPADKYCNSCQ